MGGFRGWGWSGPGPPVGEPFGLNTQSPQARGLLAWYAPAATPGTGVLHNRFRQTLIASRIAAWSRDIGPLITAVATDVLATTAIINFSMVAWLDWDGVDQSRTVTYNGDPGANGYGFRIGDLTGGPGPKLGVMLGGQSWNACLPGITLAPGANHVVATRGATLWTTYLSATVVGTGSLTPGVPSYGSISLPSNAFSRGLGDWRIYNRALAPAEVWQLYDPATRWDLYRPLTRRLWAVTAPIVAGAVGIWGRRAELALPGGVTIGPVGG